MRKPLYFILFGFCLAISSTLYSQEGDSLFTYVPLLEASLGISDYAKYTDISNNVVNEEVYIVQTNDILDLQENESLEVNLPSPIGDKTAWIKNIRIESTSNYYWTGVIGSYLGDILFVRNSNGVTGYINYLSETYSLVRLNSTYELLIRHDTTELADIKCEDPASAGTPPTTDPPNQTCVATVLVVYTDNAESVGDPLSAAEIFIQSLNRSFANSDVDHRVLLLGVEPVEFEETSSILDDLFDIQDDTEIQYLRDLYGADIVMLFTDGNYVGSFGGTIFGAAPVNNAGDPDYASAITEIDAPLGRHTAAHEYIHLMGGRHLNDPTPGFAHAHIYNAGRTLLAPAGLNDVRDMHISNPDIFVNSYATGIDDQRDNARQCDLLTCTLAGYRNSPDTCLDYSATITGPSKGTNGVNYTWCVSTANCEGNVSVIWRQSTDGKTWTVVGYNLCLTKQLPYNKNLFLRADVTCGDCETTDFFTTININDIPPYALKQNIHYSHQAKPIRIDYEVSPNPVLQNETLQVRFNEEIFDTDLIVSMFSVDGKRLYAQKCNKRQNLIKIDVSNLPAGIYYLNITNHSESRLLFNEKIIIK